MIRIEVMGLDQAKKFIARTRAKVSFQLKREIALDVAKQASTIMKGIIGRGKYSTGRLASSIRPESTSYGAAVVGGAVGSQGFSYAIPLALGTEPHRIERFHPYGNPNIVIKNYLHPGSKTPRETLNYPEKTLAILARFLPIIAQKRLNKELKK